MIEVTIDSIRVSLMSQYRVVVLKDTRSERFLTIFIGPCEADAITIHLQGVPVPRPLTHDLLKSAINTLGGEIRRIVINDLRDEIFYAQIVTDVDGREVLIDSRPSDAIALAVRAGVPIFVAESVMERAATTPDEEIGEEEIAPEDVAETESDEELSIFRDFVDTLDMDDLDNKVKE